MQVYLFQENAPPVLVRLLLLLLELATVGKLRLHDEVMAVPYRRATCCCNLYP